MEFRKYQHIEKLGTIEVDGITAGTCYVFPKLDGTNAQIWMDDDGNIQAGSRRRILSLESDNAGFYAWLQQQEKFKMFFAENPDVTLYGEWLVPHTIKTYLDTAWRNFYVFDVVEYSGYHISYSNYRDLLDRFDIDYITPTCIIDNPSDEQLYKLLDTNDYLIKDNQGVGEGIVIKNYSFSNKYGRTTWAKLVRTEFKAQHRKATDPAVIKGKDDVEIKIVEKYVTDTLVEKEYQKIVNEDGWRSQFIPRLLNTVFYCLVKEESWEFVKYFKNPTINYKRLLALSIVKIKELKPELF